MATTIRRLVPCPGLSDMARALEAVVHEALEALEDEDLAVGFGVWDDGDGVRFVCKVETPPGDPLSSEPPWRWWSSLFRTPDELRAELAEMVTRRLESREGPAADLAPNESASVAAS